MRNFNRSDRRNEPRIFNFEEWEPKTKVGKLVKEKQITTIEEIFAMGKPIKEVEIVDALIPNLEDKVLKISSVQRMTKNNRKQKYRTTAIVGDRNGHIGIGAGKNVEVRPSIETAVISAKKNIIPLNLGCGSWECSCGTKHTLPITVSAKRGGAEVLIKPAPRGVGIVAGETVKAVLELAGIQDVWTFSRGSTKSVFNTALATYSALKKVSSIKNVEALKH